MSRARWMWAWLILCVHQTTLTGEEQLMKLIHVSQQYESTLMLYQPLCSFSQTKLVCDHHGQPRDPLQHRHTWGDAPLDRPSAEIQGRLQGWWTGILSQRLLTQKCLMTIWLWLINIFIKITFFLPIPQGGYIKRWSQEPKAPLWSWRSAGSFSPPTLWTITSRLSAALPDWERWSSTASAWWFSLMRRSSRTQVSSRQTVFSGILIRGSKFKWGLPLVNYF